MPNICICYTAKKFAQYWKDHPNEPYPHILISGVNENHGVLASGMTVLGDALLAETQSQILAGPQKPSNNEREEQIPVSPAEPTAPTSSDETSVFDSPEAIRLDNIVDQKRLGSW